MKKNQYMLATAILAGGLIFALTGQAQQQPGKGKTRPGQGKAGPGQGQRPGQGQARPGQGQRPQRPGGGFSRRNPFEGIGLSEAQQAKITAIQEKQSAEMRELFQELRDGGGDRQALGAKMTALREKYQKQTDAILTDDQKKKMTEARAQRGQGGRGQGQPRPGGGFGGRRNPYDGIGLTEEQQKKITAIQQEQSAEMRELFQNGDRETMREKMTAMREKYQKKTDAVLTAEQKKKMAEARAQRDQGRQPGGQGRPSGGRGNPFASLELKEDQQKKLDAARQEMSTQLRALFTDRDTPREERTAKMAKIREGYEATVKKTLTAEQFKKYEASRPQRRPGGGSTRPGGGRPRPDGKSKERPKRSDA